MQMPVSTDQINVNWTLENLETRIKDNSEYINSLIGLIPPKYYFKNDPNNDETNSNTKINDEFQPNKRKRFSKQELKKQKKEAKKQKLDPNNLKTVLDIHKERLLNINQQKSSIDNDDDDDDDEEDDKEISEDDEEISDDNDDFDDDKSESEIDNEEKSNQSINQLQPKVQISTAERLARIRQVKESSSLQSSIKPNSKKSKQKRKSEEKKKKKQKSKINKQLKKESVNNNDNNNKEALHNDDDDIADDGNKKIKFAKFDFEQKNKKTKKQDNIHLINKLKKKSENFKKLERKDPEKAMIVKEKDAWNKVFQKAEGEKVKDDLKLLKKTVKRSAIKKKKSEKSWNERIETIAKNINEKQERRKSNIQTRIEEKKKKKMKKRK